jgi:hypothetical protein
MQLEVMYMPCGTCPLQPGLTEEEIIYGDCELTFDQDKKSFNVMRTEENMADKARITSRIEFLIYSRYEWTVTGIFYGSAIRQGPKKVN